MSKKVCLPWNDSFGGGDEYELVEFVPDSNNPQQKGTYLLKPVKAQNLSKLTKKELIEKIEDMQDD